MLESFFWLGVLIIMYTYLGYGLLLLLIHFFSKKVSAVDSSEKPALTVLIAAYNEGEWIEAKIRNTLELNYPTGKLQILIVTDGSNDGSTEKAQSFLIPSGIAYQVLHEPERRGKLAAIERVMPWVQTPILVFTDANTLLNRDALLHLVQPYTDAKVGAVAGEKRIHLSEKEEASSAGEGLYWQYESRLKRWDANLYSTVGAAGELFSIRTQLFEKIPADTLIEDFYLTLTVLRKGYRIAYAAEAYAVETASASVSEELKRKVRIAAGGLQASWRLRDLLNPFRYGVFSWQFFSHKILRWTLAPLALPLVLVLNIGLAVRGEPLYIGLLFLQILFYLLALSGWFLAHKQIKIKAFFIPFYFCVMNYAVFLGFFRLLQGQQTVLWEKVERKRKQ
jgi:cellulose synthase/poly-beta-1,6-N-acetylglucosamine synthase-like glycosyltransferase